MAFKSNGCNTIWFYIVSRTLNKGQRNECMTLLLLLVTFLVVVPKAFRFVPEDLSIYDRINKARTDIEKLLFR